MVYKVIYFSRTGNAMRIANKIGSRLSCDVLKIEDGINWNGLVGFLKGGFYSKMNKEISINLSSDLGDYDELIVVSPIWAGCIAPSTRSFLKGIPEEKVNLVTTSNGAKVEYTQESKSKTNIVRGDNKEDLIIDELIKGL